MTTWDASSRSIDITDGVSSTYCLSHNDQRSAILEEKQEDFVSYTPLDRGIFVVLYYSIIKIVNYYGIIIILLFNLVFPLEEDSMRQINDSNVNNNINLINNNIVGNRSSSSSQVSSLFKFDFLNIFLKFICHN